MLDDIQIAKAIEEIAKSKLGRENVVRVFTEPSAGIDGEAVLRVTIVITPDAVERISGDDLLENLVAIHDRFHALQDDRMPNVHYATEEELAAGDDPEC